MIFVGMKWVFDPLTASQGGQRNKKKAPLNASGTLRGDRKGTDHTVFVSTKTLKFLTLEFGSEEEKAPDTDDLMSDGAGA